MNYKGLSVNQIFVNPTEIRIFISELKKLKGDLENNQKQTSGKLRKLSESWKDAEHKKFEEKFTEYLNNMRPIISNIDEYCAFLERKANAADNYLKQR
ncbi:hypothetical protein CJ670_09560 [Arcobacter cryaerophilus gv. crypticus]|uniref:WXG100 family type VII secretion target n=1 Tax=Aliarcobacter cryaerophilus TaxID=28198 RepID=A0A2S9T8T1_9BACT|nr:hypothetical protein CJ670_09560 [Arcobacter cryaerophilus gv. crypticus]